MGYMTTTYRARNDQEAARYALHQISGTWEGQSQRVLAFATAPEVIGHGYTFVTYAAIETIKDATRTVGCMTVLQHRTATEIGWKFVDETMGPNNTRCPLPILDMLTATQNTYALAFRRDCRLFMEGLPAQPTIFLMNGELAI